MTNFLIVLVTSLCTPQPSPAIMYANYSYVHP